jgi:hypothetical protein
MPAPRRPNFIPSTPNYLSYNWLDKDPDMDLIVGLIGESGLSPEDIEHETETLGHKVSRYTIMGWLYKSVRRPQNYTMTIVALALGYSKTWAPVAKREPITSGKRPETEQPAAKPEPRNFREVSRVSH